MKVPFKVVCINASAFPNNLPLDKRVVEGEVYTVIEISYLPLQSLTGYKIQEINSFFPYEFFKATRFRPLDEMEVMEEINKKELMI